MANTMSELLWNVVNDKTMHHAKAKMVVLHPLPRYDPRSFY